MLSALVDTRFCSIWYVHLFSLPSFLNDALTWKQLDYTAGIIPVTHVDSRMDQLPPSFNFRSLNGVAKGAYKHYDAAEMHGLPVGVQVVGQRLEEEKVLAIMQRCEIALSNKGEDYELLQVR